MEKYQNPLFQRLNKSKLKIKFRSINNYWLKKRIIKNSKKSWNSKKDKRKLRELSVNKKLLEIKKLWNKKKIQLKNKRKFKWETKKFKRKKEK